MGGEEILLTGGGHPMPLRTPFQLPSNPIRLVWSTFFNEHLLSILQTVSMAHCGFGRFLKIFSSLHD